MDIFLKNQLKKNALIGLCYSGYREGQNPILKIYPSPKQVKEDLVLIKNCRRIRTYSAIDQATVIPLAQKQKLEVYLGTWLEKNLWHNRAELKKAIDFVKKFKTIKAITIGSGVITYGFMKADDLIEYIKLVKKEVKIPVATSEYFLAWWKNPRLVEEVDFLALHILPFWEGVPIEKAVNFINKKINLLRKKYPGKKIILYDHGWPSKGQTVGKAEPSLENQKKYLSDILVYCQKQKIEQFYFTAFDEDWKIIDEKEVGAHWGIFDTNRKPKW